MRSYIMNIAKHNYEKRMLVALATLVKSSSVALVRECLVDLILKPLIEEVGSSLMLVHLSMSIENRSPPVDRTVPLRASPSCNFYADF